MELLAWFWDLVVHLDVHLAEFVRQHGAWVYGLLFAIVFCETGLVVTPFLPGDSLLFVAGAVAAAKLGVLFDEDLGKRQHITATFLRAEALLGLGRDAEARAALDEVIRLDRSHAAARDLLAGNIVNQGIH